MKKRILGSICCLIAITTFVQPSVYGAQAGTFSEHYNAAQNFLMQDQYSNAIIEFRKALRINFMDNSARIGIINSYLARATYYANTEKNYEKAANDFRSALFYLKIFPAKEQAVQNSVGMISSATENLNQCLKVSGFDTTASSRYKKAEELKAVGNHSAAAYEFSRAAQNEKLAADSNVQIADILKILGNELRSADYYQIGLDLNPSDGILRMKYARTLDKLGRYDEAVVQYNEALANSKGNNEILFALDRIYTKKLAQTPSDAELNANIGAIKQALGDFDSALGFYGKAEQLNPSNVTTRLNVGTLFQQRKEYQKAMQAYDSVLMLYPDNTQALLYKAQLYRDMNDFKNAQIYYKKVLALEPSNKLVKSEMISVMKQSMTPAELTSYLVQNGTESELYDFAYKLHKDNKLDEAINAYKAVINKNSSKADAYINLAICYAAQDDYTNAINTLNAAKSKFPTNNLVLKTLQDIRNDSINTRLASASSSYENKDYRKAIQEYLAINPATSDSMLGVAASYQAMEDYKNAIEYYKKAEKLAPNNAEIPYYIGYLYSEQQNWMEAENYLKKAVKLNPNSDAKTLLPYVVKNYSLAILNDGISLFEKSNFQAALNKFNEVLQKETDNAFAYYYRGLIYDEQKQQKLAISDYQNVLKNSDEIPIANYMIAIDYDALSNYKDAYKYYEQFVSVYTNEDEYLNYAKTRMEELKPYIGG